MSIRHAHPRLIATALLVAMVIAMLLMAARRTSIFSNAIELPLYDHQTRLTWPWQVGHPDVVLVTIHDNTIWPLSDALFAQSLETIERGKPAVIGLDMIRDSYRGENVDDADELRRVFLVHPNIVAVFGLPGLDGSEFPAPPFVRELPADIQRFRAGLASFPVDGFLDHRVRRAYVATDDGAHFSLAALSAFYYASGKNPQAAAGLLPKFQDIGSLASDAGGYSLHSGGASSDIGNQFLLKFGPELDNLFPTHALQAVLAMDQDELERHFSGKVVLFGTNDPSTAKDEMPVVGNPGLRGIKLHALATSQILRELLDDEPPVRTSPTWLEDALLLLCALLAAGLILLRSSRSAWIGAGFVLAVPVLAFVSGTICLRFGTWVPMGASMLSGTGAGLAALVLMVRFERLEIDAAKELFQRKFGPQRATHMWKHRETVLTGGLIPGEAFEGTLLFSDLEGSTPASRQLEELGGSDAFAKWGGDYIDKMTEIVVAHGAFVEAFLGDGLMIPFGYPPNEGELHASAAVRCAIAMREAVEALNRELPEGHPLYRVRVGIYTGPVKGSQRGGGKQFDYALSGAAINLAKRLEEYDKDSFRSSPETVRILVSERTHEFLDPTIDRELVDPEPVVIDTNTPPELVWSIVSKSQETLQI